MATRSCISKVNADGSITSIYCHNDGYLSHVGFMLMHYYNTQEAVDGLLELGNLSSVHELLNPPRPSKQSAPIVDGKFPYQEFTERHLGVCYAYGRDRGDKDEQATTHKTKGGFERFWAKSWTDYYYQYRNGQWYYSHKAVKDINLPLTFELVKAD